MEWRTWLTVEVVANPLGGSTDDRSAYYLPANLREGSQRVHQIAAKYGNGNGTIRATRSSSSHAPDVVDTLVISVPATQAEIVLGRIQPEPDVRAAWLGDSYPEI